MGWEQQLEVESGAAPLPPKVKPKKDRKSRAMQLAKELQTKEQIAKLDPKALVKKSPQAKKKVTSRVSKVPGHEYKGMPIQPMLARQLAEAEKQDREWKKQRLQQKRAASLIQAITRRRIGVAEVRREAAAREAAALKLEAATRGRTARKSAANARIARAEREAAEAAAEAERQARAAKALQSAGRRSASRKHVVGLKAEREKMIEEIRQKLLEHSLISQDLYDSGDLTARKIAQMVPVERGGVDKRLEILHERLKAMQPFE